VDNFAAVPVRAGGSVGASADRAAMTTHGRDPNPDRTSSAESSESSGSSDARPASAWQRVVCVVLGMCAGHVDALRSRLAASLAVRSCDGSLREARRWARIHRVPWDPVEGGLRALGARCDCEALEVVERE
jgi:hypothetical protein